MIRSSLLYRHSRRFHHIFRDRYRTYSTSKLERYSFLRRRRLGTPRKTYRQIHRCDIHIRHSKHIFPQHGTLTLRCILRNKFVHSRRNYIHRKRHPPCPGHNRTLESQNQLSKDPDRCNFRWHHTAKPRPTKSFQHCFRCQRTDGRHSMGRRIPNSCHSRIRRNTRIRTFAPCLLRSVREQNMSSSRHMCSNTIRPPN